MSSRVGGWVKFQLRIKFL